MNNILYAPNALQNGSNMFYKSENNTFVAGTCISSALRTHVRTMVRTAANDDQLF